MLIIKDFSWSECNISCHSHVPKACHSHAWALCKMCIWSFISEFSVHPVICIAAMICRGHLVCNVTLSTDFLIVLSCPQYHMLTVCFYITREALLRFASDLLQSIPWGVYRKFCLRAIVFCLHVPHNIVSTSVCWLAYVIWQPVTVTRRNWATVIIWFANLMTLPFHSRPIIVSILILILSAGG